MQTVGEWLSERQRSEYNGRNRTYNSNNRGSCNTDVVHMSEYKWCYGPSCHTYRTQDRVRGSKGSKVLRTRKIKSHPHTREHASMWVYFCSVGCYNDFAHKHIERIVAIAPRHTPLETPIEDPKKTKHETGSYGATYYDTVIKEKGVDTQTE